MAKSSATDLPPGLCPTLDTLNFAPLSEKFFSYATDDTVPKRLWTTVTKTTSAPPVQLVNATTDRKMKV